MMYLESIVVNNYRPFYGENTFNFKSNEKINFNVISGKNGCGKSSLVDALYWCLYGIEPSNESNGLICNYNAVDEIDVGEKGHVCVTCNFIENDRIFKIRRKATFIKINEANEIKFPVGTNLVIYRSDEDKFTRLGDNEIPIKYFPKFLFPFIFFDMEYDRISNNFLESYLKDIFYHFGQLNVLENVDFHLEQLLYNYNKEIKSLNRKSGDLTQLLSQQNELIENLKKTKYDIQKISKEIQQSEMKCYEIKDKLNTYHYSDDGKNIPELYKRMDYLSKEISRLEEYLKKDLKKYQNLMINTFPILVGLSTIGEEFNKEEVFNLLLKNPNFKDTHFFRGYENISNLFNKSHPKEEFISYSARIKKLELELLERKNELMELERILSDINDPIFVELNSNLKGLEEYMYSLSKKLSSLKSKRSSLEKSLAHNSMDIDRYEEYDQIISPIKDRYQFCFNAKEFGSLVYEQVYKGLFNDFIKEINVFFLDKFGMGDKFKRVIIKESNEIFLIKNINQTISIDDLSASERKIFSLSLIFSIHKCLHLNYPVILMDPFVNLDTEKQNSIVSFILSNLENYQFLLILNENQYNDSLKLKFLRNHVNEFELVERDNNVEVINNG